MTKTSKKCAWRVSLTTILLGGAISGLQAQTYDPTPENYSGLLSSYYGQGSLSTLSQSQALINNSCVPTSTENGLAYLEALQVQLGNGDPFSSSQNTVGTISALQTAQGTTSTGTSGANAISGLQSYLSANALPAVQAVQNSDPTAASLNSSLVAQNAVQLGILWGTISGGNFTPIDGGGGHFVSLVGMNMTGGSGTLSILDPWGSGANDPNAGSPSAYITLTVQTVTLGSTPVLDVTYTGDLTPPEDNTSVDGTGTSSYGIIGVDTGYIALDDVESTPEPSTFVLMGAGGLALLAKWRRKA
jgi:hypothetical protein